MGAPYFNLLFVVIGVPLGLFVGAGALLRWKKDRAGRLGVKLAAPALISIIAGLLLPLQMRPYSFNAALGIALGCWIILTALLVLYQRSDPRGNFARRLQDLPHSLRTTPRAVYGMTLAHIGVGVFIIGVTCTNTYSIEKDIRMAAGETFAVAGYGFRFNGVVEHRGPNYDGLRGEFIVTRNRRPVAKLYPEKRTYLVQKNQMTEAAIDPGFTRDLYVALGEPLNGNEVWAVRIYYKPFIRWIWLGALVMALGGLLAATDRRYRRRRIENAEDAAKDAVAENNSSGAGA